MIEENSTMGSMSVSDDRKVVVVDYNHQTGVYVGKI